jgi:leucyl aminopeptidase (aminopeptidase T)
MDRAGVKDAEDVLLLCEYSLEQEAINAIAQAAREKKAVLTTVMCKDLLPGGREEPPKPVAEAIKSSDVLIDAFSHPLDHTRIAQEALFDWGVRYVLSPGLTASILGSEAARWPVGVFYEISKRLTAKIRSHKSCRITDLKGTDVTASIDPSLVWGECGPLEYPGDLGLFPEGTVIIQPGETGDGVIYFDGYHTWGNTRVPIKFTIRKGWVTKIEGGKEAKELQRYIEGVENARYFDEISFGNNPKFQIERELGKGFSPNTLLHAGVVHFGIGESKMDGGRYYSESHLDGWLFKPTIYLDDEVVVMNGRLKLLEAPEVIEAVRSWGDPKELLSEGK